MQLNLLLKDLPGINPDPTRLSNVEITGITTDPWMCKPGYLYLAAECESVDSTHLGVRMDGRNYLADAIRNGATAVFSDRSCERASGDFAKTIFIFHDQPLSIFGKLCAQFYGTPHPSTIALVTGTNGKTSVVNFCRMLWRAAGFSACSIGNLGGVCSDGSIVWERDPVLSVPETATLHRIMKNLAERHIDRVAMEATSHALFDFRLTGLEANIGAFTNLTRDHLDFHKDMDEYFRVKMTLFSDVLKAGSAAVLNADSPWFERARSICSERNHSLISFGKDGKEIRLTDLHALESGQQLGLEIFGKRYEVKLNLFGEFQASNVLCSLAIVLASGMEIDQAVQLISQLKEVEGRMNIVATTPTGGKVVVDYAHTPDGLRAALEAGRSFTRGKLKVVFGCNGERDKGKRPEMGAVAARLADEIIITDGHPRTEEPEQIRKDILIGASSAREIANRVNAIEFGIKNLKSGDTLIISGMGHEKFQSIGGKRMPYSDVETALKIVAELRNS